MSTTSKTERASQEAQSSPAQAPAPPPATAETAKSSIATATPELDVKKLEALPAEQKDLFLFTFVSDLSKHVRSLEPDDCTAQQVYLKREIFQIINLQSPQPSRVVRNNLSKCLAHILGKGDRKLLFETINELAGILTASKAKGDADIRARYAAISCLGEVFAAAGDSAIGLHPLTCSALLKTIKSQSSHAGLRAGAFTALSKIVGMVATSMDETISRDLWKQARSYASSDKGALVVAAACRCLKALVRNTVYFQNSTDFSKLETVIHKAFDSSSAQVRQAAADSFAEAMACAHSETGLSDEAIAKLKKSSKKSKRNSVHPGVPADEDELPSRTASPAPGGKRAQDLAMSLMDMLKLLSAHYVKPITSNRSRAAVGVCLCTLFVRLGEKTVETNYLKIVEALAGDIVAHVNLSNNRYRLLMSRKLIDTVLQDVIGRKILGESGQISAAKTLINNILKNYPQTLTERKEPSKHLLITSLNAVASLTKSLGSAANAYAEPCRDGLLQVLQHPSYSVQVHASACLKAFVLSCPQQLLPCLSVCMNSLNREISQLGTPKGSGRRCIGFAHGLAASLSASPNRPLYGSVDINSRVLTMATNVLKSSSQSELRVASTQVQVAWILIGGLMSLGPNFVKIHLSQLLLLWKNALPKPLAKDNTSARSFLEASYLTHIRECALGSILAFLQFNSRLLTVDVSKRIATMLQSTSAFLKMLPLKKVTEDLNQRLTPALQLQDLDTMVQRRVLQCYVKLVNLSPAGGSEALLQSNLLTLAISLFADPENYAPSSLSASIANAAANFESVWEVGDNVGYGITGLVRGFNVKKLPGQHDSATNDEPMDTSAESTINRLLQSPVCGTLEHDASMLYIAGDDEATRSPDPAATEVINTAIQLFAFAFPATPAKVQESILEQVKTFASAGSLARDPGRRAAIHVNLAAAILATMRVAVRETSSPPGDLSNLAVERLLQDIVRDFVLDQDQYVRSLGYHAVARLCNVYGNAFTNQEVKYLVDTIVGNREPSARAGCAMALGSIQTKVGGMAAGYHLKTILGIILSLCNDPHPVVHYWALEALSMASDAAGLSFTGYVPSTLGMLAQLYVSDTHHAEISSAVSMNLEMELMAVSAVAKCVDSLINVLGPDLQDSVKSRELILTMVDQFKQEQDDDVQKVALNCFEHLSMYAPGQMNFADYVKLLQSYMTSENTIVRDIAIDGIYSMMKRDPRDVLREAETGFEEQLWLVLDAAPSHEGIRNIIRDWLHQTCLTETSIWLQRLQAVNKMTRARPVKEEPKAKHDGGKMDLQDEEVAGFAAAAGEAKGEKENLATSEVEPLRWQVVTFAMACVNDMFTLIAKDLAANGDSEAYHALQGKVAEVVRIAFSASTSSVLELRIWGLKIVGAVLRMFGKTPDPDFEEAMLLEQYQAQISSALTPAFAADSSPELASEAVSVCASFISIGIVTDVDRMGRILRTLVSALESFSKDDENAGIGDLKGLSSNAQVMVKISVFSAWAELQVASTEQKYLLEVLKPHVGTLTPLWLEALREFARLRFEPDISMTLGPASLSGSLDTIYAALNRETLLKFYQDAWLKLVDAIASLIEQDSEFVFDALDGKDTQGAASNGKSKPQGINYRDEPVAFFFVLFGLAFEALAVRPGQTDSLAAQGQTLAILRALRKILHPSVSGHAIYRNDVFAETMDLLDRLVLTEGLDVQSSIISIARELCVSHPSARRHDSAEGDLSEDIDQLFELTRIIVLVLSGLLPKLNDGSQPVRHQVNEEAILLIRNSLNALVDAAEVFPSIIKTDLHACIIHIFATILATPECQELIVPQSLPTLKRFVTSMTNSRAPSSEGPSPTDVQLQGCLRRFLSIYLNAQKREAPTSLICVRNCLLSITMLFTSGQNHLPATDGLVARYLEELLDCLNDRMVNRTHSSPEEMMLTMPCQTSKIAANCIRSLLLQPSATAADQSTARYLLPRLIAFITNTEPEDPEGARALIAHALCQYVSIVGNSLVPPAMIMVIPAIMARAAGEGEDCYRETSTRLLEVAAVDQHTFKAVVGKMNGEQRTFLEEVIRSGRSAASGPVNPDSAGAGQPTIALRMNFGGQSDAD